MCEQTEVNYLEGDIVWVKLGPCWWPGQVQDYDKIPADIVQAFKKKPLAVVKFFQEDKYEYVKNLNNIYKYSCRRKDEFIKKGLDMHRNKNTFMDKFPEDVCKAESLIGGDPDIITREQFLPEQKKNYSQLFGSPSPKKSPKTPNNKGRKSATGSKSTPRLNDRRITHPRFLGNSDYGVTILEQRCKTPPLHKEHYTCSFCNFESARLNVIVLHTKSHSHGEVKIPVQKPKAKTVKKGKKKAFSNTSTIDEDLELIRKGVVSTTDSSESDVEEEKDKTKSAKRKSKAKNASNKKAKTVATTICNNLLADWSENESEDEIIVKTVQNDNQKDSESQNDDSQRDEIQKIDENQQIGESQKATEYLQDSESQLDNESHQMNSQKPADKSVVQSELLADWEGSEDESQSETNKTASKDDTKADSNENGNVSCFDFAEEEEQTVLEKSPGRKIPRVIPQKRKSSDISDSESRVEASKKRESRTNSRGSSHKESTSKEVAKEQEVQELDDAFKNILEETEVPNLPDIDNLKPNQNFQERKPIKSPDKKSDDTEKSNGVLKRGTVQSEPEKDFHISPKKRFVRSFEDFENFHHEQQKADEEKQGSNLEVSKLKSQLMSKLTTEQSSTEPAKSSKSKETTKSVMECHDTPPVLEAEKPEEIMEDVVSNDSVPELIAEPLERMDIAEPALEKVVEVEQTESDLMETENIQQSKVPENFYEAAPALLEIQEDKIPESVQVQESEKAIHKETENVQEPEPEKLKTVDISGIHIDNTDHLSGLNALAAVSELTGNVVFEQKGTLEEKHDEVTEKVEEKQRIEEIPQEEVMEPIVEEPEEAQVEPPEENSDVGEQPVIEELPEQPFAGESFIEQSSAEVPIIEEPAVEQAIAEETLITKQPIEEEIVQQSEEIIEQSVVLEQQVVEEQPVVLEQQVIEEQPIVEDHVFMEHPIEEQTVQEETIIEETSKPEDIPLPPSPKKVRTLANFSMDFSDSNESFPVKKEEQVSNIQTKHLNKNTGAQNVNKIVTDPTVDVASFTETVVLAETVKDASHDDISTSTEYQPFTFMEEESVVHEEYIEKMEQSVETEVTLESEMAKLTDTHPGTEAVVQEQAQDTSSSKLLEILTEQNVGSPTRKLIGIPKSAITSSNSKLNMVIQGDKGGLMRKFDSKSSKFVIKSATSSPKTPKPNKAIQIISERIIKPVTESDTVSVKKISVSSKRTYQDIEDIDTFVIQKSAKKSNSSDVDMQDIILTPKSETSRQLKSTSRARGKPKIIEQTIIKAADVPANQEPGPLLDDSMFDINSMPIVLSDQILTPESIENMPVVMSDLVMPVSVASPPPVVHEKPQVAPLKRGGTLQQVKLLNKTPKVTPSLQQESPKIQTIVKGMPRTLAKNQKVYQTSGTKLLKNNPAVITQPGKPGKFIILPTTSAATSSGSKYTVGKRLAIKTTQGAVSPTTSKMKTISNLPTEPTGNKIMIVTNNQGVQSRVLLTPSQQKLLAGKLPGSKITKTTSSQVKGNVIHPKSILTSKGTLLSPLNSGLVTTQKSSSLVTQTVMTSKGQLLTPTQGGQTLITSEGQVLTPLTPQQLRNIKSDTKSRKITSPSSRIILPEKHYEPTPKGKVVMGKTKTILIKGPQGQTIKKFTSGTPESKNVYLPAGQKQYVAMQGLQQAGMSGKQILINSKGQLMKAADKVQIAKQPTEKIIQRVTKTPTRVQKTKQQMLLSPVSNTTPKQTSSITVPPLTPIASQIKKNENLIQEQIKQAAAKEIKEKVEPAPLEQKHLIIQDAMGNQTTVTEGQILALPSEAVDGQPQSYMLVTVDESGNLAPISNETLMSLDPNLALGGDMSNIVLQFDQQQPAQIETPVETPVETKTETVTTEVPQEPMQSELPVEQQIVSIDGQQIMLDQSQQIGEQQIVMSEGQQIVMNEGQQMFVDKEHDTTYVDETGQQIVAPEQATDTQTVACNISTGETSQQLIITGDPESTQKFLASLSEGNTDLSSLLTGAEGNIIINTDGQQILLNTDSENQILLMPTSTEEDITQSAMYVTQQQMKNQDILAAALADTDVFQQDGTSDKISVNPELTHKVSNPQSQLSPNSALYPMNVGNVLETSLTLGSPIMTPLEVPSAGNKKVKHDIETTLMTQVPSSLELPITITDPSITQQVQQQVMLGNDLQTNLELPISIGDSGIRSTEMNSPTFVYSLPTLEESTELEHKTSFADSPSTVITTDSAYSTTLTGSMSMPLLTEEPEVPVTQDESLTQDEAAVTDGTPVAGAGEPVTDTIQEQSETEFQSDLPVEVMQTEVSSELQSMEVESEVPDKHPEMMEQKSDATHEFTEKLSGKEVIEEMEVQNETALETETSQEHIETSETQTKIQPEMTEMQSELKEVQTEISEERPERTEMLIESDITEVQSEIKDLQPEMAEEQPAIMSPKKNEESDITETELQPELSPIHPDISEKDSVTTTEVQHEILSESHDLSTKFIEVPEVTEYQTQLEMQPEAPILESEQNESETQEESKITEQTDPDFELEGIKPEAVAQMTQKISELDLPIEDDLDLHTGDICDSLSEPPPGMFDKSSYSLNETYLKAPLNPADIPLPPDSPPQIAPVNSLSELADVDSISNEAVPLTEVASSTDAPTSENVVEASSNLMEYETSDIPISRSIPSSDLSNSELNSPQLDTDETSCEIPVQPTIVTRLTENSIPTFNVEEDRKRESDHTDEDSSDSKRTKLNCV